VQKTILSTADVARLFNVTETTVKRWADDGTLNCQKTPGGHRKFLMKYVVEFAAKHHFEPLGALTLTEGDAHASEIASAVLLRDFNVLRDAFVEKALSPDETDLFRYFSYLYQHHFHLWEIYDLILTPGMREIGERWTRGEIGINHEHRASYEVMDALAKLQAQVLIRERTGHSVICACVEEELHEIGLRAMAYLFESEGWWVHYLGARTPADALISAMSELPPTVLCLSVTNPERSLTARAALRRVIEAAHARNVRVVVGGRGATGELLGPLGCDGVFTSAREIVSYIQTFPRPERSGGHRIHVD
jgi:MerR family transcriptional regulator, light-induced transcriptional regulator